MFGFCMLTYKDGESFLSVLNIDAKTFVSWPLHYIAGKTREKDLLIVDFNDPGRRQVAVFQFRSEVRAR